MKKITKPRRPTKPKPEIQRKHRKVNIDNKMSILQIIKQIGLSINNIDFSKFFIELEKYYDWTGDVDITLTAIYEEPYTEPNPRYEREIAKYNKALKRYEQKIKEYEAQKVIQLMEEKNEKRKLYEQLKKEFE